MIKRYFSKLMILWTRYEFNHQIYKTLVHLVDHVCHSCWAFDSADPIGPNCVFDVLERQEIRTAR